MSALASAAGAILFALITTAAFLSFGVLAALVLIFNLPAFV